MGRIVVCIDCPHYQKGGYCQKKRKDVGGLQPACQEILDSLTEQQEKDEMMDSIAMTGRKAPETPEAKPKAETKTEAKPKTKTCPKCKRELPRSAFAAKLEAKDGLQSWCMECTKEAYRKRAEARRNGEPVSSRRAKPTKVCKTCGEDLPISAYYLKNGRPASAHCIECRKKIDAEKRAARKAKTPKLPDPTEKTAETRTKPTPAPVIDKGLQTVKSARPLADIDTSVSLENVESRLLVAELRIRGYSVTCQRPITVIEEL